MNCCSECFSSVYLKQIINSNQVIGNCDFCSTEEVRIYNPVKLGIFFQNIFELYTGSKDGKSIEIQIEEDFSEKIFSNKINGNKRDLLLQIADHDQFKQLFQSTVSLRYVLENKLNESEPLQISWENFANEIKSTNRFHIQNTLDLSKLSILLNRYLKEIPKGRKFYRARISDSNIGFNVNEIGHPPPEKAKAGRANPVGISYLYVADDILTTFYEARASMYDYVTVGEFQLEEDLIVVNLRGNTYDPIYLAEQGVLQDFLKHLPFINKLEKELSKPRRRADNDLDYLPTQYLSEFVKSIGYDAIEYQSSLCSHGFNLAIFNPNKLKCISTEVYEIEDLGLIHKKLL